ncbi:MAG: tetratricopeptide repeat-containing protein [Desulfovibrio sp.]|nr:MAG: tetratricopeptide repeat-containing protein [Desulfovibrio sp.]
MMNKIEWYREVLELEPSSRVFFPLAKLLVEADRLADALTVLRQGLERHPDHFEAMLLLVEVLGGLERREELGREVRGLAKKMSAYPTFWQSWASALAEETEDGDSALALSFLSAKLQGVDITWSDVINQGLKALSEAEGGFVVPPRPEHDAVAGTLSGLPGSEELESLPRVVPSPADTPEPTADSRPQGKVVELVETPAAKPEQDISPVGRLDSQDEEGKEETYSYRTRTMADLLAEQGDTDGALDIYREILARSEDSEERKELQGVIARMTSPPSSGQDPAEAAESSETADVEEAPAGPKALLGKKKLINTLESLAQRLEMRAAG